MLKSDFVLELIKKFKASLNKISDDEKDKDYDDALYVIDSTLKDLFRLSLKSFNLLSYDNLIQMTSVKGFVDADKCIAMAKLLQTEGDILKAQGNDDKSIYIYFKSLNLYLEAYSSNDNAELKEYYIEIDSIVKNVSEYVIPSEVEKELFKYYENTKKYAQAEDMLYNMIDEEKSNHDIINDGISFYNRLLKKDDKELLKGNLPRNEIQKSLKELLKINL